MRYLVAKWFSEQGSLVMAVKPGQELVEMMRRIEDRFGISDLQLVNISRPSAYGEYEPFEFVHSEEQLVKRLEQQAKLEAALEFHDNRAIRICVRIFGYNLSRYF